MLGSVTNENSSLLVDSDSPMQTSEAQTDNHNTETEESKNSKERALESYLKFSGLGLFHVVLVLVSGLATAADAVEIFGVSFVVPVAEDDLGLSTSDKGWLQASIFVGMNESIEQHESVFVRINCRKLLLASLNSLLEKDMASLKYIL